MNTLDRKINTKKDYDDDFEDEHDEPEKNERKERAALLAQAALRRSTNVNKSATTLTNVISQPSFFPSIVFIPFFFLQNDTIETPREDEDLRKLRTRLEQ